MRCQSPGLIHIERERLLFVCLGIVLDGLVGDCFFAVAAEKKLENSWIF